MKLQGQDVDEALRAWIKVEVSESPKQIYELGRFLFSVSSASIGFFAAIEKLRQNAAVDCWLIAALLLLLVSVVVALDLARPRKYEVGGNTDLLDQYKSQIAKFDGRLRLWFALWLLGAAAGTVAIWT